MNTAPQTLHCCHLESYKARYTERLHLWEKEAFGKKFSTKEIPGPEAGQLLLNIATGEVLDVTERPRWALHQTKEVLSLLATSSLTPKIWFSDFYHPGLDALPYTRRKFKAYSFLWAQTFDQFDFTFKHHRNWMPAWEAMALGIYSKVFVASELLRDLILSRFPSDDLSERIVKVGLPFNYADCLSLYPDFSLNDTPRQYDVVWSSRLDTEKNFSRFVDLVRAFPHLRFVICSGHSSLQGTDPSVLRFKDMPSTVPKNLTILLNCTKPEYYKVLSQSKVQFNCASQDWVSFTLLEALTFGCIPVYPMTRSFTEELKPFCLYSADSITDAGQLMSYCATHREEVALSPEYVQMRESVLVKHSETLNRIANVIQAD